MGQTIGGACLWVARCMLLFYHPSPADGLGFHFHWTLLITFRFIRLLSHSVPLTIPGTIGKRPGRGSRSFSFMVIKNRSSTPSAFPGFVLMASHFALCFFPEPGFSFLRRHGNLWALKEHLHRFWRSLYFLYTEAMGRLWVGVWFPCAFCISSLRSLNLVPVFDWRSENTFSWFILFCVSSLVFLTSLID